MATNASGATASNSGGGAPDRPPHLVHVFPSFEYGGVPIRISTIINHLGDRYRHTILSLDGNTACSSRLNRSIEVELVEPAIDKARPMSAFLVIRRIPGRFKEAPDFS